MRTRVFVPVLMVLAIPLGALSASPVAAQTGVALLTDVQAQDMGDFDRVTFTFEGGVPTILKADYFDGPATLSPSGLLVTPPVAGPPRLQITMGGAAGVDLSVNPPNNTYTGPQRFSPDLPKVVELVEVEDFEATLSWVIGLRGQEVATTVRVLNGPARVWSSTSRTMTRSSRSRRRSRADRQLRTVAPHRQFTASAVDTGQDAYSPVQIGRS